MRENFAMYVMAGVIAFFIVLLVCLQQAKAEFKVEYPAETNLTAFWFPTDDTFAAGVSHTVIRISHTSIPKFTFDIDGTLAKEVNVEKDNLAGIGLKVNYNVQKTDKAGFVFIPSLGISALNNVKSFKTVFQDYRIAVYGTLVMYRW